MRLALVAIGYNRLPEFRRLINSLCKADYKGDTVDLIMSIDNSGNKSVEEYANTVNWVYGNKIVKTYMERQGLRKHIIHCGIFLENYDAIVVLEDDIVVSPAFYNYVKQCVELYDADDNIAGISLYTHLQNVYSRLPFIPASSRYDVYFQQMAQSWGQVWLKKQWNCFFKWYKKVAENFDVDVNMPQQLSSWGENSWLKYHIKYCIENNKYFVYPYNSLSTNFTAKGEHNNVTDDTYQVPVCLDCNVEYRLPLFGNPDSVYYDSFFERQFFMDKILSYEHQKLTVDLYGLKAKQDGMTQFLLTSRKCDFKVIKAYEMEMRPHENNIVYGLEGSDFYLYDTSIIEKKNDKVQCKTKNSFMFYYKISNKNRELLKNLLPELRKTLIKKVINILKIGGRHLDAFKDKEK